MPEQKKVKAKKAVKKKDSRRKIVKKKALKSKKKKNRFTKKDLENYRDKLLELKDILVSKIQHISEESLRKSQAEASGDATAYSLHLADRASDVYDRDFNLNLVSSEQRIVVEIDEALKRIEQNEYGFCLKCGKPIAKRRLNAVPYVRCGTKCQEEIEKEEQR